MFKVHLLRSDRVYPVIQSRLSVQISPHGSFTVRGLSELICQKVGGKNFHPWATNPLGVILLIARERKKKVTGLENIIKSSPSLVQIQGSCKLMQ